jgi:hypothetical protein
MPGALLVHVHRGPGKRLGDIADTTGMVEVDVRHGDTGEILGSHVQFCQRGQSESTEDWLPVSTSTGSALRSDTGGHAVPASEQRVDLDHAGSDP